MEGKLWPQTSLANQILFLKLCALSQEFTVTIERLNETMGVIVILQRLLP